MWTCSSHAVFFFWTSHAVSVHVLTISNYSNLGAAHINGSWIRIPWMRNKISTKIKMFCHLDWGPFFSIVLVICFLKLWGAFSNFGVFSLTMVVYNIHRIGYASNIIECDLIYRAIRQDSFASKSCCTDTLVVVPLSLLVKSLGSSTPFLGS